MTKYSDITIFVWMADDPLLKPVIWLGSTRNDLRAFPDPVQDHMGYAFYLAQRGGKHRNAKVLSGFGGAGVLEVVKDFRGDTFRAVYTLRYAGAVYVLHVFQKKSKTGRETPRREIDLIAQRLREAEKIAKERKS
ncbi:MAG TPA: type II toxin-antitoxin system RelE/ParE family toxin [Candidatus Acidoferrales bacterium]|nr:type II toxin-antitoxin system RelE/ParE family toxin [Candidatus Acidoferrales bacterium]